MIHASSARPIRALIALCGAATLSIAMATAAQAQDSDPVPQTPAGKPPAGVGLPHEDPPAEIVPPRTGAFPDTLTERSPSSLITKMKARLRYADTEPAPEYNLADETFQIYIPSSYDPARAYGLIVWVSPSDSGAMPPMWQPILDKHDLIWIGADKAGNERIGWYRFGLALDAAYNMKQRYHIDPDRIYISGISGGGRVSSRVGVAYADEFAGAFMIVGCDFYKRTPVPNDAPKVYIERYGMPIGKILAKAVRDNRYVLLTGTKDFNRDETKSIFDNGFTKEHFAHVTYLEVPDMGHELPPRDWFEKGIDALDTPLFEARAQSAEKSAQIEREATIALAAARQVFESDPAAGYAQLLAVAEHFAGTRAGVEAREQAEAFAADPANKAALDAAKVRDEAVQLLSMVDNYIKAGRPDLARAKLKKVIELVPGTDLAKQAEKRLKELDR